MMFGDKSSDHRGGQRMDHEDVKRSTSEMDEQTISSSLVEGESLSLNRTSMADMASVASVEGKIRDILAEELLSAEEEQERHRHERIMAAENASTKYYLTHTFLDDGHKLFDAVEAPVPHADKYIPTAFVKASAPDETILYK